MKYLAHVDEEHREQSLQEHLTGTANLSGCFAGFFDCREWGYCAGMLHDIGKYSKAFQDRLAGSEIKVDHATAGAQLCYKMGGMYGLLSYCIAGHHSGLPDTGENTDTATSGSFRARMKKKVENYEGYSQEIPIPVLSKPPFELRGVKNPDYAVSVFIRMMYSCLVDADFLDTEAFMTQNNLERNPGEEIKKLLSKLEKFVSGWICNKEILSTGRKMPSGY